MPNTNFQTIHQMGGAINSFVKQAAGRDAVQNIDMEHITVAQNHYYEDVDISGRVVSFNAGAAGIPLEKCLVQIEPVQEGTGDPSPDNVCPISGWTKAKVFVSPTTDEADGTTYTIAFPSEDGTVYGGTLDVTTGELVVDRVSETFDGSADEEWSTGSASRNYKCINLKHRIKQISPSVTWHATSNIAISVPQSASFSTIDYAAIIGQYSTNNLWFLLKDVSDTMDVSDFKVWLSENPLQVVYELNNPLTYAITPQEVRTILGMNNIWADTGDIEVKFKNIKEFF